MTVSTTKRCRRTRLRVPWTEEKGALHVYDLKARKDSVLVDGISSYVVSADGSKVMYRRDEPSGKTFVISNAKPSDTAADDSGTDAAKTLDLSHMLTRIEPRQEWDEMFHSAWRLERDFFYRPEMNGVDWDAVRHSYERLLPLLGSRDDLNYLIGEILGELGNSHTYVSGGDRGGTSPTVPTAFLGVDYGVDSKSGHYTFAHVYSGDNTREDYRSPLTEPGIDVKSGAELIAIDGRPVSLDQEPDDLLVGDQGQTVKLTIADHAGEKPRDVVVRPVNSEVSLRQKAWIDHNREVVDAASHGKIGYIYLSDMEELGMEQFIRQFYPQLDRQALIMDDRWNGGGDVDQIVLERLRRMLVGMSTNREGAAMTVPQQLIVGPKVCLINHYSASDGDLFPYFFRQYGLGPLIGTRTWGGVRGIRGYWSLLDGGYITIPEDSIYGVNSQWVIENHGVVPDIEVEDPPAELLAGTDAQLEAAVDYLMKALQKHPSTLPPPPPASPPYPPGS